MAISCSKSQVLCVSGVKAKGLAADEQLFPDVVWETQN